MTTWIARSNTNGLFFGISDADGDHAYCKADPSSAIVFGDAHRSPSDLPDDDWEAVDVKIDRVGNIIG